MWHLTACKISVRFSFLNWIKKCNEFYRISELMLVTLIQKYNKKIISFHEELKFNSLSGSTFYDCINTIFQFIKSFLENKVFMF